MRTIRIAATLLAAALAVGACGNDPVPTAPPVSAGSPSAQASIDYYTPPSASASSAPALPTKLPKFTGDTEDTVRTIIKMAATYAVGVPDKDRHPEIKAVEGQTSCSPAVNVGLEKSIDACYPDGPDGEILIMFSPSGLEEKLDKPVDHGGGQLWTQDFVLAAYMNYLLFREAQRQGLMTATTDDAGARVLKISMCRQGAVIGGLRNHGLMTDAHNKMYKFQNSKADFRKGLKGMC